MIKELVLKIDEFGGSWEATEQDYELFLCKDGVRKYFDVPEDSPEILLCASDKPIRGATRSTKVIFFYNSCFCQLSFDGIQVLVTKEIGEWFPGDRGDDFWFWIEY